MGCSEKEEGREFFFVCGQNIYPCFRFLILEGNKAIAQTVAAYGFDVLDLHYHSMMQMHKRMNDGMHWSSPAVRYQTNLVLSHISISRGIPLPKRWSGPSNKTLTCIENNFRENKVFQNRQFLQATEEKSVYGKTKMSEKRKHSIAERDSRDDSMKGKHSVPKGLDERKSAKRMLKTAKRELKSEIHKLETAKRELQTAKHELESEKHEDEEPKASSARKHALAAESRPTTARGAGNSTHAKGASN